MIPTIGKYLYEVHRDKVHMLNQAERRRALLFVCGIVLAIIVSVLLWMRY